jgi:hypothetical protein
MERMQCYHCGKEIRGTIHRQNSYEVDHFRLHTGITEPDFLVNPKQDAPPIRYLRLTIPVDIFTCIGCYGRPEIRQLLDDDIHSRRAVINSRTEGESLAELNVKG